MDNFVKNKKLLTVFCCLCVGFLFTSITHAKEAKSILSVKSKFITNYIPYIYWPNNVSKSPEFVTICVMEGDIIFSYLKDLAKKPNKKYKLTIKQKDRLASFSDCHILYVSKDYKDLKNSVIKVISDKPVLTLSDVEGFAKSGGISEFLLKSDGDVALKVNMNALNKSGLDINTDFLSIMEVVE